MKRCMHAAAWVLLLTLLGCAPLWAASMLAGRENIVREGYASWTGVLRMWCCEGWQSGSGSIARWLDECITTFEKRHPGVYVHRMEVSAEEMREFASVSDYPPDVIVYAPGMLEAPYGLLELTEEYDLLPSVEGLGLWEGRRYASAAALGGYALAINSQLLPTASEFRSAMTAESASRRWDVLNMPADSDWLSWSAAMICLFCLEDTAQEGVEVPLGDGIDLGLPASASGEARTETALFEQMAEKFGRQSSVYADFTAGRLAAMPVTQREIRRLELLGEGGKAPDWRVEISGMPFTDQAALVSVTVQDRQDAGARQALCLELVDTILSERMQQRLTQVRAFAAADIAPLYAAGRSMSPIERALRSEMLLVPPAFGSLWRMQAAEFIKGIGPGESARSAYEKLRVLVEK